MLVSSLISDETNKKNDAPLIIQTISYNIYIYVLYLFFCRFWYSVRWITCLVFFLLLSIILCVYVRENREESVALLVVGFYARTEALWSLNFCDKEITSFIFRRYCVWVCFLFFYFVVINMGEQERKRKRAFFYVHLIRCYGPNRVPFHNSILWT